MGDISEHFSRAEFACKCGCGFDTVDIELIEVLERLRSFFDHPITINCGSRCRKHNRDPEVGGSEKSQHLIGRAADVVVEMIPAHLVHAYLDEFFQDKYGLGKYETFTHIDTRSGRARW